MVLHLVQGLYIVAGVLFILSLAGLSKQTTARLGNIAGMIGMVLALTATIIHSLFMSATEPDRQPVAVTLLLILIVLAIGAAIGTPIARKVEMTQMPELIAFFHSMIGLAAVCIAAATVLALVAWRQKTVPQAQRSVYVNIPGDAGPIIGDLDPRNNEGVMRPFDEAQAQAYADEWTQENPQDSDEKPGCCGQCLFVFDR